MHTITVDAPSLGVPVKKVNVGEFFVITDTEVSKDLIGCVAVRVYSPTGQYDFVLLNRPRSTWNDRHPGHLPSWTVRVLQRGETFTVKVGSPD